MLEQLLGQTSASLVLVSVHLMWCLALLDPLDASAERERERDDIDIQYMYIYIYEHIYIYISVYMCVCVCVCACVCVCDVFTPPPPPCADLLFDRVSSDAGRVPHSQPPA